MPKLTARKVESLKEPGMHGDGDGLYLRTGPMGGRSWVLRPVVYGNRRDLGLGSASLVTLARRERRHVNSGRKPALEVTRTHFENGKP